jgi:ribosomal protein S18 acetylase RimI-like enzyme
MVDADVDFDGFVTRPLELSDRDAAVAVIAADESSFGEPPLISGEDVDAAWGRPAFDLATMSLGVFADGRLVACGEVLRDRAENSVHPEYTGRGIGTALAKWTWGVAAAQGYDQVGQSIDDRNLAARRLFEGLGYRERWHSWILRKDISVDDALPPLAPGVTLRSIERADGPAVHSVVERAFSEWPDREPYSYEDWEAGTFRHASFRPEQSVVAEEDGSIIGAGLAYQYDDDFDEGWVEQLAVDRSRRGRGIGRSILGQMFHNFAVAGRPMAGLSTDSRTGALTLYQHLDMEVVSSYTRWSRRLSDD